MEKPGNLAAVNGADPPVYDQKIDNQVEFSTIRPQQRKLHDPDVTFEEYYYYAQQTRLEEEQHPRTGHEASFWSLIVPSKSDGGVQRVGDSSAEDKNLSDPKVRATISDEEWANASRALRTATRGAIFYLITTDILGPFALPYAFANTGWGPGVALYTVFAGLAGYSGYLLWDAYMGLDSYQYPVRNFGDLGYRLFGPWMRHLFNVLQALQLILNVGLLVISNGEALSQAAKFKLCFAICCLIWAVVGFAVGQIRTLQKFGWLANVAIWLNVLCMIITMAAAAHTLPNYAAAAQSAGAAIDGGALITPDANGNYPPVQTSGGLPNTGGFLYSVNGAMNAIFAYGGSMIFPEFLAEMKRPKDFLTAMWAAQAFIYLCYMFYGMFIYGYQGQYVVTPSYLGIGKYSLQTAGNVFAMVSAVIAAGLYGNIGIKVIYNNVLVEIFHAPSLNTRAGKIAWAGLIPIYWSLAFVIAAGIPNFQGLTGVVAAFCINQFTYTFPPLLSLAFWIKKYSMQEGEGFDPTTGQTTRHDGGFKRVMRGFFAQRSLINVLNVLYLLGALAVAGLGAYASIEILKGAFESSTTTSFVCHSPLDG